MKKEKKRLDQLVLEQYPQYSRRQIQSWIMQGNVLVDGKPVTKSGVALSANVPIELKAHPPKFVSRAGYKLEKALDHFDIDVTHLTALDAGLSTGGFTDCLLQRGAKKVYGIDVGYGQAHERIRQDPRVIVREQINLRDVTDLPEPIDIVTLDLSFISLLKVMQVVDNILKPEGILIALIKPQFEAERHQIGKGGIVRDEQVHDEVLERVKKGIEQYGFEIYGIIESPLLGAEGNKEFLLTAQKK